MSVDPIWGSTFWWQTNVFYFFSFLFFLRSLFQVYWGERLFLRGCMYKESSLLTLFFLLYNCAELSLLSAIFPQSSQVAQWAFYYLFSSYLIFSISGYLFCYSYRRSISFKPFVIHYSFTIVYQFFAISYQFQAISLIFTVGLFL
jgi:hypothetical protein